MHNDDDTNNPDREVQQDQALYELAEMLGEVTPHFTPAPARSTNPWDFAPGYD